MIKFYNYVIYRSIKSIYIEVFRLYVFFLTIIGYGINARQESCSGIFL